MSEDRVASSLIKSVGKWIEDKRRRDLPEIRTKGFGAMHNLALDPEAGKSLKRIHELMQRNLTTNQATNAIFGVIDWVMPPIGKRVAHDLVAEARRLYDPSSRISSVRVDDVREETMRKIVSDLNSHGKIKELYNDNPRNSEIKILNAIAEYLKGEFTVNEDLWTELSMHANAFVSTSARVLHARELTRLGLAHEAMSRLGEPNIEKPDMDSFLTVSMLLQLELQGIDISMPVTDRLLKHLRISEKIISISSDFTPNNVIEIDRKWLADNGDNFLRQFGLGAIYTIFNHLILYAMTNSIDAERALESASEVARYVGRRHRGLYPSSDQPDSKTALRMASLVAIVADYLHQTSRLSSGDIIRDYHLQAMLLEDVGMFEFRDDFVKAVTSESYVKEPAFQPGPIMLGEMMINGDYPRVFEGRKSELINYVRDMRKYRESSEIGMIVTFARSVDFILDKLDGIPQSRPQEYVDARNFRLFLGRRIVD